jgi:hypothetical protein
MNHPGEVDFHSGNRSCRLTFLGSATRTKVRSWAERPFAVGGEEFVRERLYLSIEGTSSRLTG